MEAVCGASQLWCRIDCISFCRDCFDYRPQAHHALSGHRNGAECGDGALADVVASLSDLSTLAGVEHAHDTFTCDVVGRSRAFGHMPALFACPSTAPTGSQKMTGSSITRKHVLMTVEMKQIASLSHECDGCQGKDAKRSCCATYEVCITPAEMEAIVGVLPAASKYCPEVRDGEGFQNVFEETDDGLVSLDTTEDGLCVFAYQSEDGIRCGLHSAAEDLNVPLEQVKPAVCMLWPLSISDDEPWQLSIAEDALTFHCNTCCESNQSITQTDFMNTIEQVYGTGVRTQIACAAEAGNEQTTISILGTRVRGT